MSMLRHNHRSETVKPIKFLDGIILTCIQEKGIEDENYVVTIIFKPTRDTKWQWHQQMINIWTSRYNNKVSYPQPNTIYS